MLLYISWLSIPIVMSFFDLTNATRKLKFYSMLFLAIVCIFFATIRWNVGPDWIAYEVFFSSNNTLIDFLNDDYFQFETGYALLNFLVKYIFNDYNVVLFVIAFLIISLKYKTIWDFSPYPMLALLVNFTSCNADVFSVRQFISIAITMFSLRFIIDKKIYKFLICIFLATAFHRSAIIFIFSYYIYNVKIETKKLVLVMFIGIGLFCFKNVIQNGLISIVLSLPVDQIILSKLMTYQFDEGNDGQINVIVGLARRGIFVPIILYYSTRLSEKILYYKGFVNLYILGIMIFLLFSSFSISLGGRLSFFFTILEVFLLPPIIMCQKKMSFKLSIYFVFICYFVVKYLFAYVTLYDYFVPYNTIFF